jgi:arsenate reductase-like glutaredoxin family protein
MQDMLNKNSKTYKDLGDQGLPGSTEMDIAGFLSSHPKAMRRPVLTDGKRLVLGFKEADFESLI